MSEDRTRVLVEVALAVALAAALNAVTRLWRMPSGGTVSLSMLPILVVALRRGLRAGFVAGALYGVVDLLFDAFIVNWLQFILDYPLAYAMVGAAGALSPLWRSAVSRGKVATAVWSVALPATVLGTGLRFGMHWLSGVAFFAQNAPADQPVMLYSAIYNATYIGPSMLLCVAAAAAVLPLVEKAAPVR